MSSCTVCENNQLSVLPSARSDTLRARVGKDKRVVERVTRRPRRALLLITWNATRYLLVVLVPLARLRAFSILVRDPLPALLRMHAVLSNSRVTLTRFLCPSQPTRRYADHCTFIVASLCVHLSVAKEERGAKQLGKKELQCIHEQIDRVFLQNIWKFSVIRLRNESSINSESGRECSILFEQLTYGRIKLHDINESFYSDVSDIRYFVRVTFRMFYLQIMWIWEIAIFFWYLLINISVQFDIYFIMTCYWNSDKIP